jgi:hypothetical protein
MNHASCCCCCRCCSRPQQAVAHGSTHCSLALLLLLLRAPSSVTRWQAALRRSCDRLSAQPTWISCTRAFEPRPCARRSGDGCGSPCVCVGRGNQVEHVEVYAFPQHARVWYQAVHAWSHGAGRVTELQSEMTRSTFSTATAALVHGYESCYSHSYRRTERQSAQSSSWARRPFRLQWWPATQSSQ